MHIDSTEYDLESKPGISNLIEIYSAINATELKETEKLTKVSHKLSDDSDRTIGSEFSIEDDSIGGKKLFDIVEKSNSGIVGAAMYIDTYQDELRSETKSEFRNLVTKKI